MFHWIAQIWIKLWSPSHRIVRANKLYWDAHNEKRKKLIGDERFKIAMEFGWAPNQSEPVRRLRHSIHWSASRERRLVQAIKNGLPKKSLPTHKDFRKAELLTQKRGITIEKADSCIWNYYIVTSISSMTVNIPKDDIVSMSFECEGHSR